MQENGFGVIFSASILIQKRLGVLFVCLFILAMWEGQ